MIGPKVYFFEDIFSPSLVWIRLNSIDCKAGLGVRKLIPHGNPDPSGDQTANFKVTEPFANSPNDLRQRTALTGHG